MDENQKSTNIILDGWPKIEKGSNVNILTKHIFFRVKYKMSGNILQVA